MNRQKLMEQIRAYRPYNEQEETDREVILEWMEKEEDIFFRTNLVAHMTASAWVVNPERTKVLLAYHNLYQSWSWLGGHADGEVDLLAVALREVQEESGILKVKPIREDIFSIESLAVNGHEKKGIYVPSHLHLNVTYLIEGDDRARTVVKEDENSAVGWFPIEEAHLQSSEPWFQERIYRKLYEKTRNLLLPKQAVKKGKLCYNEEKTRRESG